MRKLVLLGAAASALVLGAASAYAVPQNSPYATMVPPDAVDGYAPYDNQAPYYGDPGTSGGGVVEGRSAYVGDDSDYGYGDPGYVVVDPGFGYGGFGGGGYGGGHGGFGRGGGGHFHGGGGGHSHGGGHFHGR